MKITRHGFAIIEDDTHIGKWAEESGRLDHDQNVLPIVLNYIPEGGIVVDAGAYIGDHTIAYANKVGKSGLVLAFEPYGPSYECLEYNMKQFPNVVCTKFALGKENAFCSVKSTNPNYGMASVTFSVDGIKVIRLDDLTKGLDKLNFFKIDVEGLEIDVLEGSYETIQRFKPVMFIEVNEHTLKAKGRSKKELLDTVSKLGYTYRNVYEGQGLQDDQLDIICFPL